MEKTEQLTNILKRLNSGEDPDQVKAEAMEFLATVDPGDLAIAEQNLLDAGLGVEATCMSRYDWRVVRSCLFWWTPEHP